MAWPMVDPKDDGIRPAGRPDQCFYCQQKIGQPHKLDCVIVTKIVKVRYIFEIEVAYPHYWTPEQIEFAMNNSSWCADNAVEYLKKVVEEDEACLCSRFKGEFIETTDPTPRRELRDDTITADAVEGIDDDTLYLICNAYEKGFGCGIGHTDGGADLRSMYPAGCLEQRAYVVGFDEGYDARKAHEEVNRA